MRFHEPDDHVETAPPEVVRFLQHPVRLADAGG
jgi:hypothetical protein